MRIDRDEQQKWQSVALGEVCEVNPRRQKGFLRGDDEGTSFVPMEAVDARLGKVAELRTRDFGEVKKGYTYFVDGDVLFAKITPCMQNGKHFVAEGLIGGVGFASTEFHVLRPGDSVSAKWVHFYLRQPSILHEATYYFTGAVGQQRVPDSFLRGLKIPLPPLSEQGRIVGILGEQMGAVERARGAALDRVEAARALALAFLREVFEFDGGELPRGWKWKELGEICDVQKGTTPRREWYADSGLHIIKFRDIGGNINWAPGLRSFVDPQYETKLRRLRAGVTLIAADAHSPDFIGKKVSLASQIPAEPVYFSGELLAIAPKPDGEIISEWPFLWFSSYSGYVAVQEKVVGVHLNSNPAKSMEIPLPPLDEQRRIVATLNAKMAAAEQTRAAAEAELEAIEALPGALLRRAFGGEL